jgi:tartrate-resistant acid phosphatase type 5
VTKLLIKHYISKMFLLLSASALNAAAQGYHTYVGQITANSALIAWGTTAGRGNTIGRDSSPLGKAEVLIAGRTAAAARNWLVVSGLKPDTAFPYEVKIDGRKIGEGTVRTYPEKSDTLTFYVIGDWGTGKQPQYHVAASMQREFEKRRDTANPVRFVITTGENIYADVPKPIPLRSGDADSDWESKFYLPYSKLISQIPFYPSLGNHDGNDLEKRGDLATYLDNFFFPGNKPARYYSFNFAGLADFFALDTTKNSLQGPRKATYEKNGEQYRWLQSALAESKAPWRIPYFHTAPYNAGPFHKPALSKLSHFVELFQRSGVAVVFNGHEHNFQISDRDKTGGITYVISGAGGELRKGDIYFKLAKAGMKAFAAERHFLLVEIRNKRMEITPISEEGKSLGNYVVSLP